jgi:hypothetical protein
MCTYTIRRHNHNRVTKMSVGNTELIGTMATVMVGILNLEGIPKMCNVYM